MASGSQAGSSSVQSVSSLPGIERLSGRENWPTWKFAVRTYLELEDLWIAVEPKLKQDGTPEAVDPAKDRKARAKIILLLEPVNYVHVTEAKTALEVWGNLEKAFEDSGLTRRIGLLHKLIKTDLQSCSSMSEYVNRIISTAHQLNGIGFAISDEWIGALLLCGLPEEYRPMIMALENSGIKITGDAIKTKLLQELKIPSSDAALLSKGKRNHGNYHPGNQSRGNRNQPTNQSKQSNPPKGPKCRKCHEYGHIAKDCRNAKKGDAFCTVLSTFEAASDADWYFDSGATNHMTRNKALLQNVKRSSGTVVAANKASMDIEATGTVVLQPVCNEQSEIPVNDVQYIPKLSVNLLSVNKIVSRGYTMVFNDAGCKVLNSSGGVVATGRREDELFKLEQREQTGTGQALVCPPNESLDIWHRRMGHLSEAALKKLASGLVSGITLSTNHISDCSACAKGKQCRLPFGKKGSRAKELLEVVHSDICGPMEVPSIGGSRYYIVFVDDKSRRMFVYFLRTKSEDEVLKAFQNFHSMAERQTGQKIKTIRTDNGLEYTNRKFQSYLEKFGIRHQRTNDYTPQQNGMAERANRTIVERARCMLFEAGLQKSFWAEAVSTAVYLINRSPTRGHGMTPEECWSGKKPDLSHVRIFGAKVMVHIPKQKRRKWDAKAHECRMVGFDEDTKGYRVYDPKTRKIIRSRDVTFINEADVVSQVLEVNDSKPMVITLDIEDTVSLSPTPDEAADENPIPEDPVGSSDEDDSDWDEDEFEQAASNISDSSTDTVTNVTVLPPQQTSNPPRSQVLRRSGREHKLPGKYNDFVVSCKGLPRSHFPQHPASDDVDPIHPDEATGETTGESTGAASGSSLGPGTSSQFSGVASQQQDDASMIPDDPKTHQEAMSRDDADKWTLAMQEEYNALIDNETWTLTELPKGRKAIRCKWVYKTKLDSNGNLERYKARLVIKGFSQRKGVDYDETYSPVVRHSSLRYLFAMAAKYDLDIQQMDAVTAFLQGDLTEEIFMEQPPLFEDQENPSLVCRLNKALYGLKQSSRVWNRKLDQLLKDFGLTQAKYDPCVYYRIQGRSMIFVAVYVDDVMIFSNDSGWTAQTKAFLDGHFRMKDLGVAKNCLGIRITRTEDAISLDQEAYVEAMLVKFNMANSKPAKVPMTDKLTKDMSPKDEREAGQMANVPYQEAVGSLMYLAQCTRPDILYAVNQLSRYNSNPGLQHWSAVKTLFRYLRGTSKMKLVYRKDGDNTIAGYSDADWAADVDDRKSTSGYIFTLQGAAISWCCKRQPTIALSTCEAEYMALSAAVQEASWWRGLTAQFEECGPITINCDNQSTIAVAKNGGYNPRTKHIDIRHHYIRDALERGVVEINYINTENQLADGLTKPLQRVKLEKNREAIGVLA